MTDERPATGEPASGSVAEHDPTYGLDLPESVPVRDTNGEIQRIATRWLTHPTLGKGFALLPSFRDALLRSQEAPQSAASTGETATDDDAPAPESAATEADPTTTSRKRRTAKEA